MHIIQPQLRLFLLESCELSNQAVSITILIKAPTSLLHFVKLFIVLFCLSFTTYDFLQLIVTGTEWQFDTASYHNFLAF